MFSRWFIAFIVYTCLFAQLTQPKKSQPNASTHSKKIRTNANNDQEGRPAGSQSLNPSAASKNAPKSTNSDEEADSNRKIAAYTEALAKYTLALVIVGGLQFLALIVQAVFLFRAFRRNQDRHRFDQGFLD